MNYSEMTTEELLKLKSKYNSEVSALNNEQMAIKIL